MNNFWVTLHINSIIYLTTLSVFTEYTAPNNKIIYFYIERDWKGSGRGLLSRNETTGNKNSTRQPRQDTRNSNVDVTRVPLK
jgi:hypothetical protein